MELNKLSEAELVKLSLKYKLKCFIKQDSLRSGKRVIQNQRRKNDLI